MKFITPALAVIIIFSLIGFTVYWLWQRQPKPKVEEPQTKIETVVKNEEDTKPATFITSPKPYQILADTKLRVEGIAQPDTTIIIITDSQAAALKSQKDGTISYELEIPNGLSLIQVVALDQKFEEAQNVTIPVYVSKGETKYKAFYSGSVNKIFENTITLSTIEGTVDIATAPDTQKVLTNPAAAKKTTGKPDVRVGDYLIVLGQANQEVFRAELIEIFRDTKPVINASWVSAKISSVAKSNIFSATSTKDNKLIELTLNKNSQIMENGKKVTAAAIVKDKTAIIIYKAQNDNLTLLLHFL